MSQTFCPIGNGKEFQNPDAPQAVLHPATFQLQLNHGHFMYSYSQFSVIFQTEYIFSRCIYG